VPALIQGGRGNDTIVAAEAPTSFGVGGATRRSPRDGHPEAIGYNSAALQHTSGQFKLHDDLKKYLYDKGKGCAAKWDETGDPLCPRHHSAAKRSADALVVGAGHLDRL
jgi:hypothetical protein